MSDVVADPDMDEATRRDIKQWTGCIAGALTRDDFERELAAAGFEAVEIQETHPVHEHAGSAIVRARLGTCGLTALLGLRPRAKHPISPDPPVEEAIKT